MCFVQREKFLFFKERYIEYITFSKRGIRVYYKTYMKKSELFLGRIYCTDFWWSRNDWLMEFILDLNDWLILTACQLILCNFMCWSFRNSIHCTFIITFFLCCCFLWVFFFSHGTVEYEQFLKIFIWPIDETLTGTTTPVKVDLRVMAIKEYSTLLKDKEWRLLSRCKSELYSRYHH